MARYFIESPHTPEECLQALDEVLAQGPELLARYDWGCMAGDHTGWVTIEATSETAARNMVPHRRAQQDADRRGGQVHSGADQVVPPEVDGSLGRRPGVRLPVER